MILVVFASHSVGEGVDVDVAEDLNEIVREVIVSTLAIAARDADHAPSIVEIGQRIGFPLRRICLGHAPNEEHIPRRSRSS